MRSLICMSMFGFCVMSMYVSAEPVGTCCTLGSSLCDKIIPPEWFAENDPAGSNTWTPYGIKTCEAIEAAPNAPNPVISKRDRCNNGQLFDAIGYKISCLDSATSKTGKKTATELTVCKYITRCKWNTATLQCDTIAGFPKEFKVQQFASNPDCVPEAP